MIVLTKQRIDCYECEGEECNNADEQSLYACEDAIACWKSTSRKENGTVYNNRGCISNPDHMQFQCNRPRRKSGYSPLDYRFRVECCFQDMCNGGAFPVLPNRNNSSDAGQSMSLLMLTASVLVPLLILGLIVFFASMCCRRCTKIRSSFGGKVDSFEYVAEAELNSGDNSNTSVFFAVIAAVKNSLRKMFSKRRTFSSRFSTTQKYKVTDFSKANEESIGHRFKEIIL